MSIKPGISIRRPTPTIEGAGVRLERAFGFDDSGLFDPFLLFDDFRSENPEHYRAGFPWHPHRGIETITYVLAGSVDHGDSLGNQGTLRSGDVQWMTAGSGILHQEMPRGDADGRMHGFQLWANLSATDKMSVPRYQDISAADVPEVTDDDGTTIRVVCGEYWGRRGPVDHIAAQPMYLDVSIPPGLRKRLPVDHTHHVFAYVFAGVGAFRDASEPQPVLTEDATAESVYQASNRTLVLFDSCDEVTVEAGETGLRFLLVSGIPFGEPIAWRGPIVMNTPEELREAYAQLRDGTFIAAT